MVKMKYYYAWKNSESGKNFIDNCICDPQGILNGNGEISGVYMVSAIKDNMVIPLYIGQAGLDNEDYPITVADRLLMHLVAWCKKGYVEYHLGLSSDDLEEGWKIKIEILDIVPLNDERLIHEETDIRLLRPALQDDANGMFKKYDSNYNRADLCIVPFKGQRRLAFLYRLHMMQKDRRGA